jgi:hypothetical protein
MKRGAFVFGCMTMVAASALAAASSGNSAWIGVWNGEVEGQPSVRLTMGDDGGELGGTVVFNLIKKEDGQARVIGSTTHLLMHPRLDGSTLSFQVVRPSDSRELQMTVKLESDGKAELRCLNCGMDTPLAELVRKQ